MAKLELPALRQARHCFSSADQRIVPRGEDAVECPGQLLLRGLLLQTDSADFAFAYVQRQLLKFGQKWVKVFQTVGRGLQHDNGDGELGNVLLKGQIAVNGYECIELRLRPR